MHAIGYLSYEMKAGRPRRLSRVLRRFIYVVLFSTVQLNLYERVPRYCFTRSIVVTQACYYIGMKVWPSEQTCNSESF